VIGDVKLADFPYRTVDKIRYADTDRQGHVNNAVFASFLETARVELLFDPEMPRCAAGTTFVIARLELDFRLEIRWPGTAEVGTRVVSLGRSSIRLAQAIFQNEQCVATSETVIVVIDEGTRKSTPLTDSARQVLQRFVAVGA
jgi:acyl-CoA thioester hydrolase